MRLFDHLLLVTQTTLECNPCANDILSSNGYDIPLDRYQLVV